jgi:predicted nucleotidyltransferase
MQAVSEEVIHRMATGIVREVNHQRILWFGSWVPGEGDTDSDLDFLVVQDKPFSPNRSRCKETARIWRCLSDFRIPADILVYASSELAQWKESRHHVIGRAVRGEKGFYEFA